MFVLLNSSNIIVDIQKTKFSVSDLYKWQEVPDNLLVKYGFILDKDNNVIDPNYPSLDIAKKKQYISLSDICKNLIISGFNSSATGTSLFYASNEVDQRNIAQRSQTSGGGLISCKDSQGNWSRKLHTQSQCQNVLNDFVKNSDGLRDILTTLEEKIDQCTTINEVLSISWPPQ